MNFDDSVLNLKPEKFLEELHLKNEKIMLILTIRIKID